jgi:hypothetical protein
MQSKVRDVGTPMNGDAGSVTRTRVPAIHEFKNLAGEPCLITEDAEAHLLPGLSR